MKFSIEDFFSKCNQIRRELRIWSHLLKKLSMENFSFCAVPVKGKADKAHCSLCNESFNTDKCGVSQVNAHSRGDNHQKLEKENLNQQKIFISKVGEIKLTGKFVLTKEENVIKAETECLALCSSKL